MLLIISLVNFMAQLPTELRHSMVIGLVSCVFPTKAEIKFVKLTRCVLAKSVTSGVTLNKLRYPLLNSNIKLQILY